MSRLLNFYDANGNPIEYHSLAEQIAFVDGDLHCNNVAEALTALKSYIPENPEPSEYPDLTQLIAKIDTLQATLNGALSTNAEFVGYGTFQDAYNATLESGMSETMFSWMLDDVDDKGRRVRKIIYHVGNGEFIDAIGSRIIGDLTGLTVVCKGAASVTMNSNTLNLVNGVNNFSIADLSDAGCLVDNKIPNMSFTGKTNILDVDFGGIPVKGAGIFKGEDFDNLRSVRRMNVYGAIHECFKDNSSIQYIQMFSENEIDFTSSSSNKIFCNTYNLKVLDLSHFSCIAERFDEMFLSCGATMYDLRGFNLRDMHMAGNTRRLVTKAFSQSGIHTLIIDENFIIQQGDEGAVNKGTRAFDGISGRLVVVSLSENPPIPTDSSKLIRWLPDTCTLRVPPGCTQNYLEGWPFLQTSPLVEIQEFTEGEYDL